MELVYLWIEDYKNIKDQGFNFSPRYKCDYDEKNKELTITKKDAYLENFFGENINVTAIVGENGSGKSSVLTGITNHKIIIEKNGVLYSNDFNDVNSNVSFITLDKTKDYDIIYLDYDLVNINQTSDYWSYYRFNIYDKNLYKRMENDTVGSMSFNIAKFQKNFYNLIIEYIRKFQANIFFFNPIEITLSDYIHPIQTKDNRFEHINVLIKEVESSKLSKEKFLVFLYSQVSMQFSPKLPIIDNLAAILSNEQIILDHAKYLKLEDIKEIYSFFESLNEDKDKSKFKIEEFSAIYQKHKNIFLNLINIGYFQINFKDEEEREYSSLSHGERKLFTEMLMMYDAIIKSSNYDIFIVLDEPDLTLHPDWQKKYIDEMLKLLSNFPNKNFHLIITSHSPFILSDLPKENVIFLEKYNKDDKEVKDKTQQIGYCKNSTKDITINPFGANIHTLLSHGFFMKDGLMGKFAKDKINKIIKNLADKSYQTTHDEKKQLLLTISSIGEEFLKSKLLDMYYKKFDDELTKKMRIEELKREQKKIQKELEQYD